jgi:hypothetical protein
MRHRQTEHHAEERREMQIEVKARAEKRKPNTKGGGKSKDLTQRSQRAQRTQRGGQARRETEFGNKAKIHVGEERGNSGKRARNETRL